MAEPGAAAHVTKNDSGLSPKSLLVAVCHIRFIIKYTCRCAHLIPIFVHTDLLFSRETKRPIVMREQ